MIDEIDRKLVDLLQGNAKLSNADLAQAVGLTASSVFERVKRLEQKGVITGYIATVDAAKLGKGLLAFVRLSFGDSRDENVKDTLDRLSILCASEPGILECHDVAGEDCAVLKLRVADTHELQALLSKIKDCTKSSRSVTNIVLMTMKESYAIAPFVKPEPGEVL
jgi:Lrp/AsnC family leucine-responsive transcriptional regulator